MATSVLDAAREYVSWDPNVTTRAALQALLDASDTVALGKLLGSRMAFGTAGLRAHMGPGYNQMNELTILQTTQGLVRYAEQQLPELRKVGLALAYGALVNCLCPRRRPATWLSAAASVFVWQTVATIHGSLPR